MKMLRFITAAFLIFTIKGYVVEVGAEKQTVNVVETVSYTYAVTNHITGDETFEIEFLNEVENQTAIIISKVSHKEYESKLRTFLNEVKGTMQETIHEVILPKVIENQGSGNELVKFHSKNLPTANQYTLRVSVTGGPQVTVYQIDSNGKEVKLGTEPLSNEQQWVGAHLNKHPKEELVLRISCSSGCKIADPKLYSYSNVPVHSGERILRTEDRNCAPNATARETTCCNQFVDVDLRTVKDLPTIEGPTWLRFGYCIGNCPINYNYATVHARLRHLVERRHKLPNMDQNPCLPTKMESIKVIRHTEERTFLEIVEWKNVTARSCACF